MRTILLSLLTISALSADVGQTIEVQFDGWNANASGTFQDNGSVIDLKERGFEHKVTPSLSIDFNDEGLLKNFKLNYTHIGQDSKKALTSDMQQNGVNFDDTEMAKSTVELDVLDAIYYVDAAKDDLVEVDLGLGVRYVNGSYETKICTKRTTTEFDKFIPIGYLGVNVYPSWLPAIWTSELILSPINTEHIDVRTALKKEVYDNINLEIGYRANKFHISDGYSANINSKGVYVGASYKF